MEELIDWLNGQLARTNLSASEASERAGVARGTVSGILNGRIPGLEVCKALARLFNVPAETVLRLAGHLRNPPDISLADEYRIGEFIDRFQRLPPEQQRRIMDAYLMLLDAQEAVSEPKGGILPQPPPDDVRNSRNAG